MNTRSYKTENNMQNLINAHYDNTENYCNVARTCQMYFTASGKVQTVYIHNKNFNQTVHTFLSTAAK
jgi:hypothetical protein